MLLHWLSQSVTYFEVLVIAICPIGVPALIISAICLVGSQTARNIAGRPRESRPVVAEPHIVVKTPLGDLWPQSTDEAGIFYRGALVGADTELHHVVEPGVEARFYLDNVDDRY
jgi:hypothetical protein